LIFKTPEGFLPSLKSLSGEFYRPSVSRLFSILTLIAAFVSYNLTIPSNLLFYSESHDAFKDQLPSKPRKATHTRTDDLSDTDVLEDGREVAEAMSATACLHAFVLAFAPGSPSLLTAPEIVVAVAAVLVSRSALGYRHNDGIGGLRVNVNALETATFVDTFS
jgi:hypothetical protein